MPKHLAGSSKAEDDLGLTPTKLSSIGIAKMVEGDWTRISGLYMFFYFPGSSIVKPLGCVDEVHRQEVFQSPLLAEPNAWLLSNGKL